MSAITRPSLPLGCREFHPFERRRAIWRKTGTNICVSYVSGRLRPMRKGAPRPLGGFIRAASYRLGSGWNFFWNPGAFARLDRWFKERWRPPGGPR
ncbi:MAG: hypothetical protein EWM73_03630 [Nitrospira sp.]|nr:MAG: hypothetical protein EWM73_03630 [Nitrospira sp.]